MSEIETLRRELNKLAGHVQVLAKAVLAKAEYEDEDEDEDKYEEKAKTSKAGRMGYEEKAGMYKDDPLMEEGLPNEMGNDDPMMDNGGPLLDDPMGAGGMEDDMYNEDEQVAMAYKQLKLAQAQFKKAKRSKGFARAAQAKRDEHDAPFGDKDSSLKGNEPQPAGDQGGERENETFGPGGEASRSYASGTYKGLMKQVQDLSRQVEKLSSGQVIAKAQVPPSTGNGRLNAGGDEILTREMQEQAKGATYKQLNRLRIEIGDLDAHVFGSSR